MNGKYKVLAVDDSFFARKQASLYLDDTEFDIVATAETGSDGVEAFKEHSPDVVLLDVIMPDQGGVETLEMIMELNPKAIVLMLSSLGTEETVTKCLSLGAKNFVQKPLDRDSLLENLRRAVGEELPDAD